jgi:uncharacterized membrane protein YgcG
VHRLAPRVRLHALQTNKQTNKQPHAPPQRIDLLHVYVRLHSTIAFDSARLADKNSLYLSSVLKTPTRYIELENDAEAIESSTASFCDIVLSKTTIFCLALPHMRSSTQSSTFLHSTHALQLVVCSCANRAPHFPRPHSTRLLERTPAKRLTLEEVEQHPFLQRALFDEAAQQAAPHANDKVYSLHADDKFPLSHASVDLPRVTSESAARISSAPAGWSPGDVARTGSAPTAWSAGAVRVAASSTLDPAQRSASGPLRSARGGGGSGGGGGGGRGGSSSVGRGRGGEVALSLPSSTDKPTWKIQIDRAVIAESEGRAREALIRYGEAMLAVPPRDTAAVEKAHHVWAARAEAIKTDEVMKVRAASLKTISETCKCVLFFGRLPRDLEITARLRVSNVAPFPCWFFFFGLPHYCSDHYDIFVVFVFVFRTRVEYPSVQDSLSFTE